MGHELQLIESFSLQYNRLVTKVRMYSGRNKAINCAIVLLIYACQRLLSFPK